ncbi:MAG: dipeptide epimerase [Candidatus Marinimicrobia bacterium]|jgi:L-alanine-DL-glutamate epimerase-like enolase superfamily enzyme|nr:dipeptide epimerase [Candidatus Neomarinimicrobiota bacterium]MBT3631423.1 dipeptide epimerase [Candidatus Neomarinimicrobiota bacterium]MBT3825422.1 dipeptide epimerase [Candidatus Neomarinimicrobiota bacterium]MBT4131523.1 dipeptide epimerase [Candidatus Neomarinimicrobiota bacterium]MBT4294850.1 dipeptide epimerase [Candidatus Neomarinimicrobiota bacterium]
MSLSLKWSVQRITTKFEFKIARSAESYYDVVILELSEGEFTGFGEAAPSKRYEKGPEAILELLSANKNQILEISVEDAEYRQEQLEHMFPQSYSLQAALDTAFWDLYGQRQGKPLWKIFGATQNLVTSSYTIGISDLSVIPAKIKEAIDYPILKIKLGTDYDHDIMRAIRAETDKVLRVDVNEGWKTLDDAKRGAEWLAEENVEFLEQPMPSNQLDDIAQLREFSPLPLVADENSVRPQDIPGLVGAYDGINIKLMKCGGLTNAKEMVDLAHKHEFDIMLGCMVETSIGISAMSQLGSYARWLDLDGNVLLAKDPYRGVGNQAGEICLLDKPGLGIEIT